MARRTTVHFSARKRLIAVAISACFASAPAWANPTAPQVINGSASFNQAGQLLTVNNTNGAIINWNGFSISANETTRFNQASAASSVLNRVVTSDPSVLLGTLSSNGRVWLVNPAGILVGQGARIDVAGFVASTLNVRNEDFLAGRMNFQTTPNAGSLVNSGQITTPSGGSVYLIAPDVTNNGIINAPNGEVILAAGQTVQLVDTGTPGVKVEITGAEGSATNLGQIMSEAGRIGMAGVLLKNSGMLNASGIVSEGGRVFLRASRNVALDAASQIRANAGQSGKGGNVSVWADGTVRVDGSISALGGSQAGDGGFIETSGAHVSIAETARVSTLASNGKVGAWLIDPQDYTVAASGGDITGATLSTNLESTAVTLQSSNGGTAGSGDVNINDTVSWSANTTLTLTASNNVNVKASITATGATAGIAINPNASNGTEVPSDSGAFRLGSGGSISLPNVSPTSTTALVIGGTSYTVINILGAQGSVTGTDLQGMTGNLGGVYALGSNIDASTTSTWNGGLGFLPIHIPSTAYFTGYLDGMGHTISGLTINRPSTSEVGLFGHMVGTVKNVTLSGATIVGAGYVGGIAGYSGGSLSNVGFSGGSVTGGASFYVGGLVGQNASGTIDNSYSSGNVTGTGQAVGGLAGWTNGAITNSYATGNVSGGDLVGGLVGRSYSTSISNSYATGNVTATSSGSGGVGGLVGDNLSSSVNTSYSTGTVSLNNSWGYIGGLVGSNNGSISDSYATGNVTAIAGTSSVGGIVGENFSGKSVSRSYSIGTASVGAGGTAGSFIGTNAGSIASSFWDTTTSGANPGVGSGSSTGLTGLATGGMQTQANISGAGWNFSTIWRMYDGYTYPLLKTFLTPLTITAKAASKTYDGLAYSGGNDVAYSVASPTLYGALTYGGTSQGAVNAGNYVITPGGYYSTGQHGYDITFVDGALTVNPAAISSTTTINLSGSRVYDGTMDVAAGIFTLGGLIGGQTLSLTGVGSVADKNVGVNKPVTLGSLSLGDGSNGGRASNYSLIDGTHTATITARPLSIAATGASKVYDGLTSATASLSDNRVAGDVLTVGNGSASYLDKNVGVAKTVNVSGITLSGTDAGNYSFNTSATTTADITVRPLSTWIGGVSGSWSVASNWDALPDLSNVLAVSVPAGKTVTYDAAAETTNISSLTAAGLIIAGGTLNIANKLTVSSGFSQTGGTLGDFAAGSSASITQASGNLNLPKITVANLSLNALAGAITQSGPFSVTTLITQSQGATTLDNASNQIAGRVDMSAGGPIALSAAGDLNLGAINAGANAVAISAGGAISQFGTTSPNIIAGSATLTSVNGGAVSGLAIVADTQVSGALSATVGSDAAHGGISIQNIGPQPSRLTLVDNALAGASVGFLNSTDITDTTNYTLKTLNGGDLSLLSGGNLTWTGGSMSTPSGSAQLGANGALNVTGILSIDPNVDLGLSAGTGNAINISGGVSTAGSGTIALTAPTVNVTGSVNAGDDVGSIATSIVLGSGSSINAGHDVIFAATDLTANNASVLAAHDISVAVAGDMHLNASSFVAGNDIYLKLLGPTSTLFLNDTTGLPPSYLWAQSPDTVHLQFADRTTGGVVVDGAPVDLTTFVTLAGGSGFFYGPAKTPAVPGAGLDLVYPIGAVFRTTPPTLVESVIAAFSSSVNAIATTSGGVTKVTVLLPTDSSGTGTLGLSDGDHTTGGTAGTFGRSSDEDENKDKGSGNSGTGSDKPAEKPASKKLSVCS